jgi:hypothetical protein
MAAMKMKAMKVIKKPSSGVHDVHRGRFKTSLKKTEEQLWKSVKRIMADNGMRYERTILKLKECLASEAAAEFDVCRLFPHPSATSSQTYHASCIRGRSHIPEGLGLEAGPQGGKRDLYIWMLVVPGKEAAEEGTTTAEKVDREICVPEPMYSSLRIRDCLSRCQLSPQAKVPKLKYLTMSSYLHASCAHGWDAKLLFGLALSE